MSTFNRRQLLQSGAACTAAALLPSSLPAAETQTAGTPVARKGNIKQSVSRWCYQKIALDDLCVASAQMGLKAIDLLQPDEWEVPRRHGLICSMGYADAGSIPVGLNRIENHDKIEAGLRKNVPLAAKAGVPNVITFSGNRAGQLDWEGARNTILGLKRVKSLMEDNGVVLNLELLNSKHDHHDYMADHTDWGVAVMGEVNSKNIKLLYDIYHMQIMEGDMIATIQANHEWLGHFHTGGVPGRHELDDTQEINWIGVMRGIAATGYTGYVAHEFVPTKDPLTSLRQAVDLCDV
ncbi:MAG TPA: TIM barrel protein [Acidobacteriaceae bacterium]|jgi:hydroxypyruvate isomerase|nr:TIM barrel protein [Acidobacteriaceae bacterium]